MLREIYQETILEHGQNPRNFGKLKRAGSRGEEFNPLCGDMCVVYLTLDKGAIKKISFEGQGCLISKASASLMTESLQGKSIREAADLFFGFQKMVRGEKIESKLNFGKLAVFSGISKHPSRINCALLPWFAMSLAYDKKVH